MLVIVDKAETVNAKVHDPVEKYGSVYGRQKEIRIIKLLTSTDIL